uniref:Uncharacterized protein n=1 Tax=Caenorhabditis japonica TaxID=281687 RepID=A0A8R1IN90_CAEJA
MRAAKASEFSLFGNNLTTWFHKDRLSIRKPCAELPQGVNMYGLLDDRDAFTHSGRGLWASEKPTDEWSERINGGTCEQLVKELGRFVKTKSRKLFRPDAAVLVGKCTIWTKSCETIKSLRESGIPFGILKSEDQVAFGKLKSPNM